MQHLCETCKYSLLDSVNALKAEAHQLLQCRRFPPGLGEVHLRSSAARFVLVKKSDYCGEHEAVDSVKKRGRPKTCLDTEEPK